MILNNNFTNIIDMALYDKIYSIPIGILIVQD